MNTQKIAPLSNQEVSAFCSQMSMILQAGISSTEGLELLQEDCASSGELALLKVIQEHFTKTGSMYEALASANAFPNYMLHMVEIGEQTGKLDTVFEALSSHYDREASISQAIKNAVTYPAIMITMLVAVILVLIIKVMPIFNQVFLQLGSEMTGFSKAILAFGQGINRYAVVLVVIVVILVALILFFAGTNRGRQMFSRFASRVPFLKNTMERVAAGRFASGMYLTLSSGLNPEECLEMTAKLTDNPLFSKKVEQCKTEVEEGVPLSKALLSTGIFSGLYAKMTSIGSRTGSLDEVMDQIADKYNEEIEQKFINIINTLEPTLVIILSIVVGLILLSVMLPLMGILSSI